MKHIVRCYNKDCAMHQLTQDDSMCQTCGFYPPEDRKRKALIAAYGLRINSLGLKELVLGKRREDLLEDI